MQKQYGKIPWVYALFFTLAAVSGAYAQQFSAWSAPVNLGSTVNSATGDFFSFISKDGLSLYFTSLTCGSSPLPPTCRPGYGGFDIFVSQRATVNDPWGPPQNLGPTINTSYNDAAPSLSVDGHVMYFASDRPGGFGGNDLYLSRRHNEGEDFGWQPPENLGNGVNTSANEAGPAVFEDDTTGVIALYFDSNRLGGPGPYADDSAHNGNDIYASTLQADGTFGPAVLVAELSTPYFDRKPAIRRDGLEMILTSNRPESVGANLDLWVSTRATTADPWSTPVPLLSADGPLGFVNSGSLDAGPALSFDGRTLYFQSDRPGGLGAYDLYVTIRTELNCTITLPTDITTCNDPGQCGATVTFAPTTNGNCGTVSCSPPSGTFFPVGTTSVTCTNGSGQSGSFNVTVNDCEAPVVSCALATSVLLSPDHNLVNVGLSGSATDNCSGLGPIQVMVFSDEAEEGQTSDGSHSPDAKELAPGTLRLRSERKGDGDGRVYLIVVKASDAAGNVGVCCRTVIVPRDESPASLAAVEAQAAAAREFCGANGGEPPPAYFVIGVGPIIGPKQ